MKKWLALGLTLLMLLGCRMQYQYNALTEPFGISWESSPEQLNLNEEELEAVKKGYRIPFTAPKMDFSQETVTADYRLNFKDQKLDIIIATLYPDDNKEAFNIFKFYEQLLDRDYGNKEEIIPSIEKQEKCKKDEHISCDIKRYRFTQGKFRAVLAIVETKSPGNPLAVLVLYRRIK